MYRISSHKCVLLVCWLYFITDHPYAVIITFPGLCKIVRPFEALMPNNRYLLCNGETVGSRLFFTTSKLLLCFIIAFTIRIGSAIFIPADLAVRSSCFCRIVSTIGVQREDALVDLILEQRDQVFFTLVSMINVHVAYKLPPKNYIYPVSKFSVVQNFFPPFF